MIMIEHNRGLCPRVCTCIVHGICSVIEVMTRFHHDKALVNVDLRLTVFFVLDKAVLGRFFIC